MHSYLVTSPDGRKVKITGEKEPSSLELDNIFSSLPTKNVPKKESTLKKLGKFIVKPAIEGVKLAEFIGAGISGEASKPEYYNRQLPEQLKGLVYSPEEIDRRMGGETGAERFGKGLALGSKGVAGLASYAAPFASPTISGASAINTIAPTATDALTKLLNVGTSGAFQGGAREYSEEETTPVKVAGQAAVGGITSAAAELAGMGLKAGGKLAQEKLSKTGEFLSKHGVVKKFGKPSKNLGGTRLLDEMDEVGIKISSPEKMVEESQRIINTNGETIGEGLHVIPEEEILLVKKEVLNTLDESIAKIKSKSLRDPANRVQSLVAEDLNGIKTAEDFYKLKQEYGVVSHWSIKRDLSESEADTYRTVYTKINEELDKMLKNHGEEAFRKMNRQSSVAIKVRQYAEDILEKEGTKSPIGLTDLLFAGGGLATGGPMGAVKSYVAKKLLLSPTAFGLYGTGVGWVGKAAGVGANIAGKAAQSSAGKSVINPLVQFMSGVGR
jgi:hypothetical protein